MLPSPFCIPFISPFLHSSSQTISIKTSVKTNITVRRHLGFLLFGFTWDYFGGGDCRCLLIECSSVPPKLSLSSLKAASLFVSHIATQRLGSVAVDAGSSVPGLMWHKWRWWNDTDGSKGSEVFSHTAAEHRSSCSCRDLRGVPPPTQILILLNIMCWKGLSELRGLKQTASVQLPASQRCPEGRPMVTPVPDHRVFICFKIMSDKSKIRSLAMELLTLSTMIDSNQLACT